jgi:RHS repeat-associated protein
MRRLSRLLVIVALALGVPISAAAQETVEYYGTDAIGSVRIVFDATGTIIGRMDYGPFGEQVTVSTVGHKSYAGLFRDGEAGLDYAEARSYQVRTGRFSTVDPVYAGLFAPQAWNRYSYALNSPLTFVDPEGLRASKCTVTEVTTETGITTNVHCVETGAGGPAAVAGRVYEPRTSGGGWLDRLRDCVRTRCLSDRDGEEVQMAASPQGAAAAAIVTAAATLARTSGPTAAKYAKTAADFPSNVLTWEWHHVVPQYLGGARDGLQVLLRADYHQAITNAFRQLQPYGTGGNISPGRLTQMMNDVYTRYPLPPDPRRGR